MQRSENFSSKVVNVAVLIGELRNLFEEQNFKFDPKEGESGATILTASKSGIPRDWLGLALQLTVRLNYGEERVRIWIGNQKWVDKIIVGFIGLLLLQTVGFGLLKLIALLLVSLPAIGAYLQFKVTQDAWNVVKTHEALRQYPPNP